MTDSDKLIAWVEVRERDEVLAAFVGAPAVNRRGPATLLCSTTEDARQWVEEEASALGVEVKWIDKPPSYAGGSGLG